jgi:hypothetical protein
MTTLATTSHDLASALHGLAAAAGRACDDTRSRAVLAVLVQRLEDAAGAGLGDTSGDPLVVLQRRFGRAHAHLAVRGAADVDAALLHDLAQALEPEPAGDVRRCGPPLATAALAGC